MTFAKTNFNRSKFVRQTLKAFAVAHDTGPLVGDFSLRLRQAHIFINYYFHMFILR